MPFEDHGVKGWLATKHVAEKFKVTVRTVDRWVELGILPDPKRVNGRKYWPDDVEPETRDGAAAA